MNRTKPAPSSPLAPLRVGLHAAGRQRARAARAARRALEHDLACYTSTADRAELEAILSRHSEEQTAEIRHILDARTAA
jgi:hypothetical protein